MDTRIAFIKRNAKIIALSAILITTVWIYRHPLAELLQIIQDQEAVSSYLQGYGSLGPIILFVLLIAQVFIAIIPGHALMVTAGYAYGIWGLFVTLTSTILGSQIAFLIAHKYGRSMIYRLASPEIIDRWDSVAKHQGIIFYFFSFVLPVFPSDLMCYVAGLGTISPKRFFIANFMGRTCCAVFITLIGIYGMHPPAQFWIISLAAITTLFLGWGIYKRSTNLVQFKGIEPGI